MNNKNFNFIDYIKNNYKLFIPILLMVVLFISFFIYYNISINNRYHLDTEGDFYQYFYDKKYNYKGIVSTNRKDVIVDFKVMDASITKDSTPIYYKKSSKVIFASDMDVVMPTLNCSEYLASGYSYIEYNKNRYKITLDKYSDYLGHYFLYDGNDLYFFIEETILKVGSNEVKLSPMSYVVARYGKYVSYYDKESDGFKTITYDKDDSVIKNDYYTINISTDSIDYYGSNVILTKDIDKLNSISMKG